MQPPRSCRLLTTSAWKSKSYMCMHVQAQPQNSLCTRAAFLTCCEGQRRAILCQAQALDVRVSGDALRLGGRRNLFNPHAVSLFRLQSGGRYHWHASRCDRQPPWGAQCRGRRSRKLMQKCSLCKRRESETSC